MDASSAPIEPTSPLPEASHARRRPRIATGAVWIGVALLGGAVYFALGWRSIHGLGSIIDEGLYLYKGYLFANGIYIPFQDGGPWTNHMPLSFLIPGWVQAIFGLGMRTGRFYALALGMLMLLGVWINARRLGGLAWAAVAVWPIALSPFLHDVYGKAQSQVLIACMLAWVLVLTLGRGRPLWQIMLGSCLAGLTLFTRINMLPMLPILLVYIFWEHGRRAGIWATAISLGILAGVHLFYWPEVLKLWAKWLPDSLTPFLATWREPPGTIPAWDPRVRAAGRIDSFELAIKQHPTLLLGSLAALTMWPPGPWSESERSIRRAAALILSLVAGLTLLHAWAALGNNYCVWCFTSYLAFFSQLGVYLLVIAGARWYGRISAGRRVFSLVCLLMAGIVLWPNTLEGLPRSLRSVRIPRMAESRLLPGETTVAGLIKNLTGITAHTTELALRIAMFVGVVAVVVLLVWVGIAWAGRRSVRAPLGILAPLMGAWLLAFTLGFRPADPKVCQGDVIASFEAAGEHLARWVPPGSTVYWGASASPAPLLYIPQAKIFPAQLNGDYTFRLAGDPADLQRFGAWNPTMAARWLAEADFVLIYQKNSGVASENLDLSSFEELPATPPLHPCQSDTFIRLFRRIS